MKGMAADYSKQVRMKKVTPTDCFLDLLFYCLFLFPHSPLLFFNYFPDWYCDVLFFASP